MSELHNTGNTDLSGLHDITWVGCGECDCIFPCYNGKVRCIRLPIEPIASQIPAQVQAHSTEPNEAQYTQPVAAPDTTWADKYSASLRPIALQFGQQVFEFTMAVGMAKHATQIIMRRIRGNNELTKAMIVLTSCCNKFSAGLLKDAGFAEDYQKCKTAIETSIPDILIPQQENRIVLPS